MELGSRNSRVSIGALLLICFSCTGTSTQADNSGTAKKDTKTLSKAIAPAATAQKVTPPATVVLVYDDSCTRWCTEIKPLLSDLKTQFPAVRFLELNASPSVMPQSQKAAEKLHLKSFLTLAADQTPVVGVFTKEGKQSSELTGFKSRSVYAAAVKKALGENGTRK